MAGGSGAGAGERAVDRAEGGVIDGRAEWRCDENYGPLTNEVNAPFRGRWLPWDEYERLAAGGRLGGRAFWSKVPDDHRYRGAGIDYVVGFGYVGSVRAVTHQITEHEDGTITITPSLIIDGGRGERWHGFLNRGVFTGTFECYPLRDGGL